MKRHPLDYTKENVNEIIDKPLSLGIGEMNSDEITETIEGIITKVTLAANPPHLPGTARIELNNGKVISKNFFEIKNIDIL